MPSLLLLLPQFPLDPASGAVRSLFTMSRWLAEARWSVTALGATATDAAEPVLDWRALARAAGATAITTDASDRRAHRFRAFDVDHIILDTAELRSHTFDSMFRANFDAALHRLLAHSPPDLVLTIGASPAERARQAACRAAGSRVILGVRQHGYLDARAFEHTDGALFPSRFLADLYRRAIGEPVPFHALPTPMVLDDLLVPAAEREPVFVTFVNPTLDKGVMLFARIAEDLAVARPDIPMLVIESRGSASHLLAAGKAGGFDLARHESLMISPSVPTPRDIFRAARVLLVPSLWEEPSGRVIIEAMLNAVPPIITDRGGMPETLAPLEPDPASSLAQSRRTSANARSIPLGGGFVIPAPADLTQTSLTPPSSEIARPWVETIITLCDDEPFYAEAARNAHATARLYTPEHLQPRYLELFSKLAAKSPSAR